MRTIFGSKALWIGVAMLVIGTGPLLASVAYAEWQGASNPNPVIPGILAMFTFWPGILLIVIGLGVGIARYWKIPKPAPE